jgi:hypothetical protein
MLVNMCGNVCDPSQISQTLLQRFISHGHETDTTENFRMPTMLFYILK